MISPLTELFKFWLFELVGADEFLCFFVKISFAMSCMSSILHFERFCFISRNSGLFSRPNALCGVCSGMGEGRRCLGGEAGATTGDVLWGLLFVSDEDCRKDESEEFNGLLSLKSRGTGIASEAELASSEEADDDGTFLLFSFSELLSV